MEASETKYALLSYRKNWDDRGDTESSEIDFDDQLSFAELEQRITQLRESQPDDADRYGDGAWQFLVFADGVPVGNRGPDLYGKNRWNSANPAPKLWDAIMASVEDLFQRADISSEEKKQARLQEQIRKADEERKRERARMEAVHYDNALDSVKKSLETKTINPEVAFKEKALFAKLKSVFEPEIK